MAYFGRAAVFSKSVLPRPLAAFGSVHRPGRRFVCELGDRIPDPAPDRYAVVIVGGCQLIGARFAFLERLLAIAREHRVGGAPDIDLGYHAAKLHPCGLQELNTTDCSGCKDAWPVRRHS